MLVVNHDAIPTKMTRAGLARAGHVRREQGFERVRTSKLSFATEDLQICQVFTRDAEVLLNLALPVVRVPLSWTSMLQPAC